jgi:hypothetical protein
MGRSYPSGASSGSPSNRRSRPSSSASICAWSAGAAFYSTLCIFRYQERKDGRTLTRKMFEVLHSFERQ